MHVYTCVCIFTSVCICICTYIQVTYSLKQANCSSKKLRFGERLYKTTTAN